MHTYTLVHKCERISLSAAAVHMFRPDVVICTAKCKNRTATTYLVRRENTHRTFVKYSAECMVQGIKPVSR